MELPAKEVMCHRTGFARSCRDLVTSGACRRWQHVPYETPPTSVARPAPWACVDDHLFYMTLVHGKLIAETTASVDKVATQVAERGTDTLGALARLGYDIRGLSAIAAGAVALPSSERPADIRELPSQ